MTSSFKKIVKYLREKPTLDTTDVDDDAQIIDFEQPEPKLSNISGIDKYKAGFKIIILGDVGVGKTSLFSSLIDKPNTDNFSTFRPESGFLYHNDIIILLNDTVGQEAFKSICQNYYREPQIVMFVFDISRIETFMNIPQWQQEVIKRNDPDFPIKYYLVANKYDLNETKNLEGAKQFAKDNDMTFIITSVKNQNSISSLKNEIFQYVNNNKDKGDFRIGDYLHIPKSTSMKGCCNVI